MSTHFETFQFIFEPKMGVQLNIQFFNSHVTILRQNFFLLLGRVQMTAAAFAKGLLALEGELTPILVQMVKSANTNGLLDNENEGSSKYQNM